MLNESMNPNGAPKGPERRRVFYVSNRKAYAALVAAGFQPSGDTRLRGNSCHCCGPYTQKRATGLQRPDGMSHKYAKSYLFRVLKEVAPYV